MKKTLSVLLCVIILLSQLAVTSWAIETVTIESIEINDVELVEGIDGFMDSYYDENMEEHQYFYYYWEYYVEEVTLNYSDGTSEQWPLYFFEFEYDCPEQDYFNQWTVGNEYEITVTIEGVSDSFTVSIVENPIDSIQVVETAPLIADIDGYMNWDYDEYENEYEYFYYDLYLAVKELQVVYTDGTTETVSDEDIYWYATIEDDQAYDNPWTVGTYTATLHYQGVSCEFEVEIIPNTVVSIEVEEVLSYTEYVDGSYQYEYDESFNEVMYFYYDTMAAITTLKVTHDDGTVELVDPTTLGNITTTDDQGYWNPWTEGTHTVVVSYAGQTCEFDLVIEPNGVEKVEVVEAIALQEDWDGYLTLEEDRYGIYREYFEYEVERAIVKLRITYDDGEVIERYINEIAENFPGIYYVDSNQSYSNRWKVGNTYKAELLIYGNSCNFDVKIEKSSDYAFQVIDGELYIIGWTEKGQENRLREITLPEELFGYPVSGVTYLGAKYIDVKSITVPDSFYYIGPGAFIEIETLENVYIGKNVANVTPESFSGLVNLKSIEVDETNESYASVDGVLYNKKITELVAYPEGKGSTYTLPATIKTLYTTSYYDSVDFVVAENSEYFTVQDGVVYTKDMKTLVRVPKSYVGYYIIPEGIEIIDFYAFYNCTEIYQVVFAESVTEIREGAFAMCPSLTALLLPSKLEYLGAAAFLGCENLKDVIVQEGIQYIGELAFLGVAQDFMIHYTGTQSQWDEYEFSLLDELIFSMYTVKCYGRTGEVPHVLNGRIVTTNNGSDIMERLQPIKLDENTGVYMGIEGWIIKSAVEDKWQDSYRFLYAPKAPTVMITVYYKLGDADADGDLTASDITEVIKSMKNGYVKYADTDYDGAMSAADITNVIKLMKGTYEYVDQPQ